MVINQIVNQTIKFSNWIIEGMLGSLTADASVAAGKLGMTTGVVTKIGIDLPPNFLKVFREANVNTREIKIEGRDTTHSLLI